MTVQRVNDLVGEIIQRRGRRRLMRDLMSPMWWKDPDVQFLAKTIVLSLSAPWKSNYANKTLNVAKSRLMQALTGLPR